MKLWTILLACAAALPLAAATNCSDSDARQQLAWESAVKQNPSIITPDVYTVKELDTSGGYAYILYFNTQPQQKYAQSVMVAMDESCKILHIDETPRESRIILTTRRQ